MSQDTFVALLPVVNAENAERQWRLVLFVSIIFIKFIVVNAENAERQWRRFPLVRLVSRRAFSS